MKNMRRYLLSPFLVLTVSFSLVALQKRADESTPSVDRLRAHISYLASDKLEGRRTGSPGANMAAEYIAREFSRYGLKRSIGRDLPGMSVLEANSPRRYMQEFPYVAGVELGPRNSMLFTQRSPAGASAAVASTSQPGAGTASLDLRPAEDWMPLGFSSSADIAATPAVFVGYGIKADDLRYNDYAGAQVRGHIAIAIGGTPDGDNPHGQFAQYADVRWKAIAAREQGASALIVISREENFKDDRLSTLSYDNNAGETGLPVVVISRQAASRILEAGGLAPLAQLEKFAITASFPNPHQPPTDSTAAKETVESRKNGAITLRDVTLSITTDLVRRNAPAYNVVGILDGSDPILKNEVIVIGAHYDHLGRGGSGSLATREGAIHYGADDNASGVAGVLELARIFSGERAKMKRTLVFIAFGGEEEGLIGSRFYINHPVVPVGQTVAMINMDMIGRMKEGRLMIGGVGTSSEWRELIAAVKLGRGMTVTANGSSTKPDGATKTKEAGVPVVVASDGQAIVQFDPAKQFALTLNEDGYGPSDHSSFYVRQVPVLFFFTGTHDDYHKPSDTPEKINYHDEARILSFVASLVRSIEASAKRPTYTVAKSQSQGRTMGFRVYLGTIPNYSESTDGLKLDGVREESPAAKAGLKAGDRIVKMAGREVRNVYDYTYVLGEMKAGQEYEIEAVRGSETLRLKITPTARR